MKAIILAAGKGTRMRPLTDNCPKQMVQVAGRPLLEHIIERLPHEVDELILIIGYCGDMIRKHCGVNFLGRRMHYVEQKEQKGPYHALALARDFIREGEQFFVMYGDDIHGAEGFHECLKYPRAVLVDEVEDPRPYGVVETDTSNIITNIVEKPAVPKSNLVSSGVFLLDDKIFHFPPDLHPEKKEYFLADAVGAMIHHYPCIAVRSSFWLPVTTPQHVAQAEYVVSNAFSALKRRRGILGDIPWQF